MTDSPFHYARTCVALARADRPIVVLDTETTGIRPERPGEPEPRIYDLAAMRRRRGAPDLLHGRIIDCGVRLDPEWCAKVGIEPDLPASGADGRDTLRRFAGFIDGAVLVGHNIVDFDAPILAAEYRRYGLPVPRGIIDGPFIDTLRLARHLWKHLPPGPRPERNTLIALGTFLGCDFEPAALHGARADVQLTAQVLGKLLRLAAPHVDGRALGRAA